MILEKCVFRIFTTLSLSLSTMPSVSIKVRFSFDTILLNKNGWMAFQKSFSIDNFFYQDYYNMLYDNIIIFWFSDKGHALVTLRWMVSLIVISSIFQ